MHADEPRRCCRLAIPSCPFRSSRLAFKGLGFNLGVEEFGLKGLGGCFPFFLVLGFRVGGLGFREHEHRCEVKSLAVPSPHV